MSEIKMDHFRKYLLTYWLMWIP